MWRFPTAAVAVLVAIAFGGAAGAMDIEGTPTHCPMPATVIVTDQLELRDAVAWASPGDVIGIDGMIELTPSYFADDFFGGE